MDNQENNNQKKLTVEDRVFIAISGGKTLREVAEKFNLHHSTVDELQKEAKEILHEHFKKKSAKIGRPARTDERPPAVIELEKKVEALRHQLNLKNFREDYLELELKWAKRYLEEAKVKKETFKKKGKKKKS